MTTVLLLCAARASGAPPLKSYGQLTSLQRRLVSPGSYQTLQRGPRGRDRAGVFLILTRRMERIGVTPAHVAGYALDRVDYSRQRFQMVLRRTDRRARSFRDIVQELAAPPGRAEAGGFFIDKPLALFHRGFTGGAREARRSYALQLGWSKDSGRVFVDMDKHNPRYGAASRLLHWTEIIGEKLTHYMRPDRLASRLGWQDYLYLHGNETHFKPKRGSRCRSRHPRQGPDRDPRQAP
jgi:hypothetical protein